MQTIQDFFLQYQSKLDRIDLELIIAHEIKKTREFVLIYPEKKLTSTQIKNIHEKLKRRINSEPLAYVLGYKDFFNLTFQVTKDTLIPRPETEMMIEMILKRLKDKEIKINKTTAVIDIGTGSGNIIITLAKNLQNKNVLFFASDISFDALQVAKQNAKKNHVQKKIYFSTGDLLQPFLKQNAKKNILKKNSEIILLANLPYLSKKIYSATAPNVKNFEPKSALYSSQDGLHHYTRLLHQINTLHEHYKKQYILLEFSPEQKPALHLLIKKILPFAKIDFQKDLAKKWRVCSIELS